ncbi:MAG: type IV secretion system protein [Micavibrio sp.]|nr:type IV secretion system protein [Micavibrio sp.]
MAGGGQQAENTLHEAAIGWAILIAIIAVVLWLFWYYNSTEVRNIVRWIRYGEMWFLQWPIMAYEQINLLLGGDGIYKYTYNGREHNWRDSFETVPNVSKYKLNYAYLSVFSAMAMQPLKPVFLLLCVIGTYWALSKGPRTHYRTRLNLEGLIHRQSKNFPVIAPFAKFNPATQPPRPPGAPVPAELPAFAEALGPEEWLAYHAIPIPDGVIDEGAASKAFQKQLVARWKGPKELSPERQILLAAFCLKAARKRIESDDLLGRLALCWNYKGGLNMSADKKLHKDALKILNNKDLSGTTLSKCNQHAFVTTALLRALQTAREEGGVLAPAQFAWLRGYDRTLWYPLNNLGRQSFHMEAIGAMSHFKQEKMTQRPIPLPKVEFAVETIVEYMKSRKARPIPQLDYSNSKKSGVKKAV